MSRILMVFVLLYSSSIFADLPQNDLWKQDNLALTSNVTEKEFLAAIKELQTLYQPIVGELGGTLRIKGNWNDSTVNAYASQSGSTWHVQMFGGLARRPEMTVDGFKLVICHEIGHHIGGAPSSDWASYEGQADYYATHVCGKKIFKNYSQQANISQYCTQGSEKDRIACSVNLNAAQSLANLLSALAGDNEMPQYSTPDRTKVKQTQSSHPQAQCRLDTYLAGEVCLMPWDDSVIPDYENSVCDNRPACWYAK